MSFFTPDRRLLTSGKVPILTQVPVTFFHIFAALISACLYTGQGFGEAFGFCSTHQNKRAMSWKQKSCLSENCAGTSCSCGGRGWTRTCGSRRRATFVEQLQERVPGGEPLALTLPLHPPFTPTSLHFTLGLIYTGTLIFSPTL